MKLHIGGQEAKDGWTILDAVARPEVDVVGLATDLSMFPDASVQEVYASHILEHLDRKSELPVALKEIHRVLAPGCLFGLSVPDLRVLGEMIAKEGRPLDQQWTLINMIYGGQDDEYDYHRNGFTEDTMCVYLAEAGFDRVQRVRLLNIFDDASGIEIEGRPISLNMIAKKAD